VESRPASHRKRGADHLRQIGPAIRLCQQQRAGIEKTINQHGAFRIARRIQTLSESPRFEASIASCRPLIAPGMITSVSAAIDDCQRFAGIARGKRHISEAFQLGDDVSAPQRIVLDNQNCFIAALDTGVA
jgi:hypothetical protein